MRKNKVIEDHNNISILALDDDNMMTLALQAYFQASGYRVDVENDPNRAIERVREGQYDVLLLDFLMEPICGDEVVARIREFNQDLFIILLTGHKSLAPPIKTIRALDIQGYYEKSDRFDQLELLVESCVKSIRQMQVIRRVQAGLQQIIDDNVELLRAQTVETLVGRVFIQMQAMLGGEDGFIYVDPQRASLITQEPNAAFLTSCFFGTGVYQGAQAQASVMLDELGRKQTLCQVESNRVLLPLSDEGGRTFGLICLDDVSQTYQSAQHLVEIYLNQAATVMVNTLLQTLVRSKNQELEQAYLRLKESYFEMVSAVRVMVDAKDIYTRGHSDRVSYFAEKIASRLGRDADYLQQIRVAGLFHDIGKLSIPDRILLKNGRLTDQEYARIKRHPLDGSNLLSVISVFQSIAPIVVCHHERVDGTGYPHGLVGSQIPEQAKIISIADAFDAMTSDRQYRKSLGFDRAIEQLVQGKDTQFDGALVEVFVEILKDYDQIQQDLAWTYDEDALNHQMQL